MIVWQAWQVSGVSDGSSGGIMAGAARQVCSGCGATGAAPAVATEVAAAVAAVILQKNHRGGGSSAAGTMTRILRW